MRGVVRARVFQTETFRKIEIELHCRPLPLPADCIDQLEVELWSVERAATFVHCVFLSALPQHLRECFFRLLPRFRAAECLVGPSGELDGVRVAERLEHLVAEIEQSLYF